MLKQDRKQIALKEQVYRDKQAENCNRRHQAKPLSTLGLQYKLQLGYSRLHATEPKCLHLDEVNITTFDGKIGTFEDVYGHLRASWVTMDHPCSAAMCCNVLRHNATVRTGSI